MLWAEAHPDEPRRNPAEQRIPIQEAHGTGNFDGTFRLQRSDEDIVLNNHLHPLRDPGWEFSSPLYGL